MRTAKMTVALGATLLLTLLGASSAHAAFGLNGLGVSFEEPDGSPAIAAGNHPFALRTLVAVNTVTDPKLGEVPDEAVRDLVIDFPAGMVGNPTAVPQCSSADFGTVVNGGPSCSAASAIGVAKLSLGLGTESTGPGPAPPVAVYNLEPAPGTAAKIGFVPLGVPVTADLTVNPHPPYNVVATLDKIAQPVRFYASDVEVWGNPASAVHDDERGVCATGPGTCPVSLPEKPFLTTPRSCEGPLQFSFAADSWEHEGAWLNYDVTSPFGMSGCASLGFAPEISSSATTTQAAAPSGLQFNLDIDDPGLTSTTGTADSDIKKAVVTLPEGMTVNPGIAEGLQSCSQADLARETPFSEPGEGCPQASKVGEVEVETPLLEGKLLKGQLFVATPYENPVGSLIALYMIIQNPELGISVKLAGKVEPDPKTGQLVTTFGEPGQEIPQFPFSHFRFRFREGARAPLITPKQCGAYETKATFTPWANPNAPYTTTSSFEVKQGPNGGPCASAPGPFAPGFEAGTLNNQAGAFSDFLMRWTRSDGEQDITRFGATLPPGAAGILAGIPECSQAQIEAARSKSGRAEQASPSCPAASAIGSVYAGAGAGSQLTYVPGKVYLAGPYKGAPFSVVGIVPAVAGPFDVGTVVTQLALRVNPVTTQVTVDGATSDPIPHILAGIPLAVRDIRAFVDRERFTFNPTSCRESEVGAQLWGGGGDPFSIADDSPFSTATRFQAAGCGSLDFEPKLNLQLIGGTKRGDFPAFRAVYKPRAGDANLRRMVLRFPSSAFLEQAHIRTICTRVQFAAKSCPPGSIYGKVRAFTPILDQPLEGPVYLRSSSNPLPDVVFALNGRVEAEVAVEIDSSKGGIRATVASAPDVPISKVVLNMQGGRRGLIVNSTDLCAKKQRANLSLTAHSGARASGRPLLKPRCKGQQRGGRAGAKR